MSEMYEWIIPMSTVASTTVTVTAETYEEAVEAAAMKGVNPRRDVDHGDFEPDEYGHWKDGEYIETPDATKEADKATVSRQRETHEKRYHSTADEVRDTNPFCSECARAWPCDARVLLDIIARGGA